jgi:hypothetical protein
MEWVSPFESPWSILEKLNLQIMQVQKMSYNYSEPSMLKI